MAGGKGSGGKGDVVEKDGSKGAEAAKGSDGAQASNGAGPGVSATADADEESKSGPCGLPNKCEIL